jgi:hypothetical protein
MVNGLWYLFKGYILYVVSYSIVSEEKLEGAWSLREMGSTWEGGIGGARPPKQGEREAVER